MLAAHVDLEKTFENILRLRGIPTRIIGLLTGLYSWTVSFVKCGVSMSGFFPMNTGARQG